MSRHQRGVTIWLTGLSGAGKSTIAERLAAELERRGRPVETLDGDVVRTHLSSGLGFSREDRDTNVRRIAFVARLVTRHGGAVITAAISPYRATRDEARATVSKVGDFLEVYVSCPIEETARRDVKGLYARARRGEIPAFTGLDDPYEPPLHPDVTVHTDRETVDESVRKIWDALQRLGHVPEHAEAQTMAAA